MNRIYAVIKTDDYSTSMREFVGFYSTEALAREAMYSLARYIPNDHNLHVEAFPFDQVGLNQHQK